MYVYVCVCVPVRACVLACVHMLAPVCMFVCVPVYGVPLCVCVVCACVQGAFWFLYCTIYIFLKPGTLFKKVQNHGFELQET